MSPLIKLPNEMLDLVTDHLLEGDPYDIEALALTCKALHTSSERKLLQHRQKKARYIDPIVVGLDARRERPDGSTQRAKIHPLLELRELLEDNEKRRYVRTLALGHAESYAYDDQDIEEALDAFIDHFFDQCSHVVEKWVAKIWKTVGSRKLDLDARDEWSSDIIEGVPSAIFVFLIAICPNLTRLEIDSADQDWQEEYEDLLKAMTAAAMVPEGLLA